MVGSAIGEPSSISYRLAGALNGAIFGGLAGGLAAALQYIIQKKMTTTLSSIAAAVGFMIGQTTEHGINFFGDHFYDANVKPAVTRELMARELDEMPIYQALRKAAPNEYSKLRSEVARRVADRATGAEIEVYTQQFTATIRRNNAEAALVAPPGSLHSLVQATRNILNYFQDNQLCVEYVLQGFGSPRLRALAREPAFAGLIERSAVATFETIAAGLSQPTIYQTLSDSDVQQAMHGLSARGWTDEMRAGLADPVQLQAMPAELACRITKEWLSTLASFPEPARSRWYREVLGPMLRS